MSLDLTPTLILLAAALGVFALAAWRSGREPDPAKGPRLIPWTTIAITAAAAALLFFVHVLNLFGVETGRGRPF